jgi:signal transduction histidine kinase
MPAERLVTERREEALAEEKLDVERGLVITYLGIRTIHLAQGAFCVASGWSSYRRPKLAAGTLAMCAAEAVWLARRSVVSGIREAGPRRVDTVTGLVGLLAMAAATRPEDRTTSLNWMMPLTVGSTIGHALTDEKGPDGIVAVTAMSATYLVTAVGGKRRSEHLVTALTNAASYAGFYAVANGVIRYMRRSARELAAARQEASEQSRRLAAEHAALAVERERNRQHRLIHDSALQTLEAVATGRIADPRALQVTANAEVARLRSAIRGDEAEGDLDRGLAALVAEMGVQGLKCEYTCDKGTTALPEVAAALVEATREALRNVAKHSGVSVAIIRAASDGDALEVIVRDHGAGFDPAVVEHGFGMRQSVHARLGEIGGSASIWSAPGRGTRVTLRAPS